MREYIQTANEFLGILNKIGIEHAIIGGVAAGMWSEERTTKDIDFTVSMNEAQWPLLKEALEAHPETSVFQTSFDSGEKIPFLVRLRYKGIIIDLLASLTPYQDLLIQRKVTTNVWGYTVNVASAEDIILLKLLAHRGQDIVDLKKIFKFVKQLDHDYIDHWAKVWEVSDLWEKIKKEIE